MSVIPSVRCIVVKKSAILISNDGNTLYVGGNGTGNYTQIQDAIDNASDGDTVFVYNESSPYYENVIVNKSINLIGEDRNTTIIDGNWNEVYVLRITADYVGVSGFMIKNSGNGIEMWSNHSIIKGNIITNNNWNGIYLYKSHDNHIIKNNISKNGGGIWLDGSKNNIIMENEIIDHSDEGIRLDYSIHNNISRNIISNSTWNIVFHFYSSKNIIRNNIIRGGRHRGILIMYGSNKNTIYGNTIANSGWVGIQLETNGNKVCHNNFIKNKIHACFVFFSFPTLINYNKWDGNYWDNWIGLEHPLLSKFPKIIVGALTRMNLLKIPCFTFDWNPK